jgi:hypothetical protein
MGIFDGLTIRFTYLNFISTSAHRKSAHPFLKLSAHQQIQTSAHHILILSAHQHIQKISTSFSLENHRYTHPYFT